MSTDFIRIVNAFKPLYGGGHRSKVEYDGEAQSLSFFARSLSRHDRKMFQPKL